MTVFDNTMIDAVVRTARSDAQRWVLFRREHASITRHETDYAAEQALRYWVDPSRRIRAIDGWAQQFILDFCTEAANGRCRVSGFVGTTKIAVPAALFTSFRLIKDLWEDGKGIYENEIRLPDGTLVAAVSVTWGKEKPPEPRAAQSSKRERPHWAEAKEIAFAWMDENGAPLPYSGEQAKLELHISDHLKKRKVKRAESTIRNHVVALMQEYEEKLAAVNSLMQ
jgi:hypothetical protein